MVVFESMLKCVSWVSRTAGQDSTLKTDILEVRRDKTIVNIVFLTHFHVSHPALCLVAFSFSEPKLLDLVFCFFIIFDDSFSVVMWAGARGDNRIHSVLRVCHASS
jgi:hypothetical protein